MKNCLRYDLYIAIDFRDFEEKFETLLYDERVRDIEVEYVEKKWILKWANW